MKYYIETNKFNRRIIYDRFVQIGIKTFPYEEYLNPHFLIGFGPKVVSCRPDFWDLSKYKKITMDVLFTDEFVENYKFPIFKYKGEKFPIKKEEGRIIISCNTPSFEFIKAAAAFLEEHNL
jgi:hypothetical protein